MWVQKTTPLPSTDKTEEMTVQRTLCIVCILSVLFKFYYALHFPYGMFFLKTT